MSPKDAGTGKVPAKTKHGPAARPAKADGGPPGLNARPLRAILVAVGVIAAVGLGALVWRAGQPAPPRSASQGIAAVGGPFQMVDQDGAPVDESVLKGKWSAVFFGYTYCPDVCPATLTLLGQAQQRMGDKGADLQTVMVSVDPARDTPEQLKAYIASPVFPKPIIGLTGTPAQLAAMAKEYRVYYARSGEGEGYLMDHSSAIYLMDPQGRFVTLIRPDGPPDEIAKRIDEAMAG